MLSIKDLPSEYQWIVQRGILGDKPFSQMNPWYLVQEVDIYEIGQEQDGNRLIVFARRQDCDDLACYLLKDGQAKEVLLIEGWTSNGYDVLQRYENIWDWLKSVIEDIQDVFETST
jgi:hypothetical protein